MSKNQNVVKQQRSNSNGNIDPTSISIPHSPSRSFFAANDGDFNSFGIAETPRIAFSFTAKKERADASLFASPTEDGWVSSYRYAIRSGESCGETLFPSIDDISHASGRQAIATAAANLLNSLAEKYPDTTRLNKTEVALVEELRQWAMKYLPEPFLGEKDSRPLVGMRFVDLFAGIGGFRHDLEQMGAECVLTCEIDRAARETYAANFDTSKHPFPEDITKLKESDVPDHDILVGGFPCQAFSIAGLRKGFDDQRGQLFFEAARIIKAKQPKLVVLENVGNFLRLEHGRYAKAVEDILASMGYAVSRKTLMASDFGLPQLRERAFFVAIRRDCKRPEGGFIFPVGKGCEITVSDILEPDAPDGNVPLEEIEIAPSHDPESRTQRVGWVRGNHWQSARVMSPDGIGLTLVTGKESGSSYLVNGKARFLTPRERARMQGFPENFILHPSKTQAFKQLGNSVALPVVKSVLLAAANQVNFHEGSQRASSARELATAQLAAAEASLTKNVESEREEYATRESLFGADRSRSRKAQNGRSATKPLSTSAKNRRPAALRKIATKPRGIPKPTKTYKSRAEAQGFASDALNDRQLPDKTTFENGPITTNA